MKKEIKYPKLQIEIELPTGARVGTLKVFSDLGLFKDPEVHIKQVLDKAINNCIDKVFMSGIYKISEDALKSKKL